MSGVFTKFSGKKIAGTLTAVGLLLAPIALYADASAPWVNKTHAVKKHKVKHVMHKRKKAVRSVRRAPRPQAAPEPTYTPPPAAPEPVYTPPPAPPEPVYTPPPAPEPVPTPPAPTPVAAAPAGGGGLPILAILGGLAAIGGIVAVATGGSTSP